MKEARWLNINAKASEVNIYLLWSFGKEEDTMIVELIVVISKN